MALRSVDRLGAMSQGKREQILAAAQGLFLQHGFGGTSMEAIRAAAGVSKPTLYTHYENKEALFADVLGTIITTIGGDWLPAMEADTLPIHTRDELRAMLLRIAQQAISGMMRREYLALLRVVVAEMGRFPELGTIFRTAGPDRGLHQIATYLAHADAQGLIAVADADVAARLFLGPLITYVLLDGLLASGEPQQPTTERVTAIVDTFMSAVDVSR